MRKAKTYKRMRRVPVSAFVTGSFGGLMCKVFCPYCKQPHFHGFGDGHRIADCKDGNENPGYLMFGTLELFQRIEEQIIKNKLKSVKK